MQSEKVDGRFPHDDVAVQVGDGFTDTRNTDRTYQTKPGTSAEIGETSLPFYIYYVCLPTRENLLGCNETKMGRCRSVRKFTLRYTCAVARDEERIDQSK